MQIRLTRNILLYLFCFGRLKPSSRRKHHLAPTETKADCAAQQFPSRRDFRNFRHNSNRFSPGKISKPELV